MSARTKTTEIETKEVSSEDILETAQAQAAADEALMAQLQARDGKLQVPQPPARRRITIGESFADNANLIAMIRKNTRLSEQTLVKLFELTLMWQLNNKNTVSPDLYPNEEPEDGGVSDGESLPEPHEIITGTPDETEENEDAR